MSRDNESETKSINIEITKKEINSKFLWDKSNEINEAIFTCLWSYVRTFRSRYQSPSPQVVIRPLGALFRSHCPFHGQDQDREWAMAFCSRSWIPFECGNGKRSLYTYHRFFLFLTLLFESSYFFKNLWKKLEKLNAQKLEKISKFLLLFLRFRNFEIILEN